MYFVISSGSSKSPELQCLLHCLKYLELSLAICLEVVHILGAHMIDKGIDGLSQGLHLTGGHPMHPPMQKCNGSLKGSILLWTLFSGLMLRLHPCKSTMIASTWMLQWLGPSTKSASRPLYGFWLLNGLEAVTNVWIEQLWETDAFFVKPHVFQWEWGQVTKHIMELGTFSSHVIPIYSLNTAIPCVILHLPCCVHSLPPPRWLDRPSQPQGVEWHWEQAEQLHGLS